MKKIPLLTTLLAGSALMGSSLTAATYTMKQDGRVGVGTNYNDPTFTDFAAEVTSADSLNNDGGWEASLLNTNSYNGATINVTGTGSLQIHQQVVTNATINIQDTATFFSSGGDNARISTNAIVNYDSSAISTSTGEFKLNADSLFNLNSGGFVVGSDGASGESFQSLFGGVLNMNGGDLSFDTFLFSTNVNHAGSINFDSTAGSMMTFTGATAMTDFDDYITSGFIQIDGTNVVDMNDFNRDFSGGTLTLSVAAVPEPSSTALLGLGGVAMLLRRRRA